jgi:hypothetical protein
MHDNPLLASYDEDEIEVVGIGMFGFIALLCTGFLI